MIAPHPVCLFNPKTELGEGPMWHAPEQAFYFVDIKGRKIHRCDPEGGNQASWSVPGQPGFIVPAGHGRFVCGIGRALYLFIPASETFTHLCEVEGALPGNRLNDAHVDARGRLWFGSMDNHETAPSGSLYRLGADGRALSQESGIIITNGPACSPDGRTFYHTDTLGKTVHAYDLDNSGSLSRKRHFATIGNGWPDGSTVDAEGCVWVALFGGRRVERYSPAGELLDTIYFPCSNITKIAFGGADLRTVLVTTAWKGLSPAQRAEEPLAGALFTFRAPVPGLPQHLLTTGVSL
ncbi:MAG: SMP-30/gluconolactonase/LRE family protein [Pseudomonadota bacterium]